MNKRLFTYRSWGEFDQYKFHFLGRLRAFFDAGKDVTIAVLSDNEVRNNEQNKKMWACINDFVKQEIKFNGELLTKEDWKIILVSAWQNSERSTTVRVVKGFEGEPVALGGYSTSKLTKKQFADLITVIQFVGSQLGVVPSDPALAVYDEYLRNSK